MNYTRHSRPSQGKYDPVPAFQVLLPQREEGSNNYLVLVPLILK